MALSKIERLSHYAIVFIAMIALVVSIWQVQLLHKHNKLTVKPYLDAHLIQVDSTLKVSFSNEGFGPAIIKDINFKFKGQTYPTLEKYLVASGERKNRMASFNYGKNTVVASGDDKLLVKLRGDKNRDVEVIINYESIYEDKEVFVFSF